ncbi:BnaC03g16110D [Brassica napus]|uniref:Prolamin-like domain-containing protein n=2 Tax=Brassica TaxID=3705 RepID=A0A0D3B408_BRAOL|nr:PREDICTED: uncharacterized protein LOC106329819 [Brassica oleracea var. oleracea]CAF1699496.1 unnamed protein product [Brassica napus]CDY32643.1 BnaC03g16110D [Brassica napus]
MSIKNVHLLLLVTICIASSANAQFPFPFPFQPSPGSMPGMPGMSQCWSTLMDIPGCFAEIRQSIMTGKFGSIGPACCKAFLDAEANCTKDLPFKPFFPPMLKEQCSRAAGPSAGPPTTL